MATKAKEKAPATESKQETAAKSKGPTVVKKLSVKTVYGDVLVRNIPEGKELPLARFAGKAFATDEGEGTYGPWRCLVGECAATNKQTGEIFIGRSVFIPGPMNDALIDALNAAQKDDAGVSLTFSVDVSVKQSSRDANKYEYVVRPVIETDVKNEAMLLLALEA
jgi:hypothetical protein